MSKIRTHYDNLKIARNAPDALIKAAYKVLLQQHHPDKVEVTKQAEALRITHIIRGSYDVLSDPVQRAEHDHWISEQENNAKASRESQKEQENKARQTNESQAREEQTQKENRAKQEAQARAQEEQFQRENKARQKRQAQEKEAENDPGFLFWIIAFAVICIFIIVRKF